METVRQDDALQVTPDGKARIPQELHRQVGLHVASWNLQELPQVHQPQLEVLFVLRGEPVDDSPAPVVVVVDTENHSRY